MLVKHNWKLIKEEFKDITYKLLRSGATTQQHIIIKTYVRTILNKVCCMVDIGRGAYCYCSQEDYDFAVKSLKEVGFRYGKDQGFSNVFVKVSSKEIYVN